MWIFLELRFESRRESCLGVSKEIEEPAFSGPWAWMELAEVDWERGEGDLTPCRCGLPGPGCDPEGEPFRLLGSCMKREKMRFVWGRRRGRGQKLTSTAGLEVPAHVARTGFPRVELVKSPTSYRLSWCHRMPQGSLGSRLST